VRRGRRTGWLQQCRDCTGKQGQAATGEILSLLGLGGASGTQEIFSAAYGFCRNLGVEMRLSAHGASRSDLPAWALEAHAIRRLLDNNPRLMSPEDISDIYEAAY